MSNAIQLKPGDQLEITGDSSGYPIGTILTVLFGNDICHDIFVTNAPNGNTWTVAWYMDDIMNGSLKPLVSSPIPQSQVPICQCGTDKHGFATHSTWCDKYKA